MQRWARGAGPERQEDRSPSQYLKLARGAKECHGNQTKFVSLRGCGHGRNIGWRRRARRPQEQGCRHQVSAIHEPVPTIHQSPLLLRSTTRLRRIGSGRSSFSNVEVHALMSDATNEDSVEKSKVTVGFVWSIAASGDAIQR